MKGYFKEVSAAIMATALVAVLAYASLDNVSITLDISKDPVVSDTVYWRGEAGGINIPAHTSASVKVQTCADLGIGGLDWFDGIAQADHKLLLYCGMTSATTVLTDYSGSSNDFNANDTFDNFSDTTPRRGYAYDLAAGTNVFFTRADDADFDAVSVASFTFSCWFQHDTISSATDYIINKMDGTGNTETGWCIYMETDGDITYAESDDGSATRDFLTTSATYDDNAWHHLVVTREAGANARIYIDGSSVTNVAHTQSLGSIANAAVINIGGIKATTNLWDGHLDNILFIADDYPTATEVSTYYNRVSSDPLDVQGCILDTTANAGYLDIGEYLSGYYGYIRLVYGAAQAADETSTLFYTR